MTESCKYIQCGTPRATAIQKTHQQFSMCPVRVCGWAVMVSICCSLLGREVYGWGTRVGLPGSLGENGSGDVESWGVGGGGLTAAWDSERVRAAAAKP